MSKKIIIADNNEIFSEGLKNILSEKNEFDVCALGKNDEQLISQAKQHHPDIVIVDYSSDNITLESIAEIRLYSSDIQFIGITNYFSGQEIVNAWKSGIISHLQKRCSIKELKDAIKATLKGEQFFCGQLVENLQHENIDVNQFEKHAEELKTVNLSERELEIIKLIAEGYTNAQIAVVLYISNHTVNTHRKNIMKKIGVNNTAGIVMYAVKMKLVQPEKFSFTPDSE